MKYLYLRASAQLASLLNRLGNITQLDKADTPVSSLAPASAALSNAVWTNTHAARVDTPVSNLASQASANALSGDVGVVAANVDAPISQILTSALRANIHNYYIKEGQTGETLGTISEAYYDVSITPVNDINQCLVFIFGAAKTYNLLMPNDITYAFLSNSAIRLKAWRPESGGMFTAFTCQLTIMEFI